MSRVLLTWELGANYGHLAKLAPLARVLKAKGHEVALAVRDLTAMGKFLDCSEAIFLQAPLDAPPGRKRQPTSFADILDNRGFGSPDRLGGLVRGWQGIFELYRPNVVVAEYAPSAVFSARLFGIPCLMMTTGFAIPPEVSPWPSFRPWLKQRREQLLEKETGILQAVNLIRSEYGQPAYGQLYQSVRADLTLLTTVPELDHYPVRKGGRYIGPLLSLGSGQDIPWPTGTGPRLFTYLRPFPELGLVLDGLKECGGRTIAVVPGLDQKRRDLYSSSNLVISDQPVSLKQILPEADLVLSHAGHGLTSEALLAGVPTLALPTQIEQMMLTKTIERLGIGIGVSPTALRTGFGDVIQKVSADQDMTRRVQKLAIKYKGYDEQKILARLVTTIERLPGAVRNRRTESDE